MEGSVLRVDENLLVLSREEGNEHNRYITVILRQYVIRIGAISAMV